MLTTIPAFRHRVASDMPALVADLQHLTGRYGEEEAKAWKSSLEKMSRIFQSNSFKPLHLYFGSRGQLALEYQLPASSSWCDVVLLGAHESRPAAVIVELKDWQTRNDRPGDVEGLVWRQGALELHPSDQVRGYAEYCRRFHSAVQEHGASVHGCVLFTRDPWTDAYTSAPNSRLTERYPIFTMADEDVEAAFPDYFRLHLNEPHEVFAQAFEQGRYRQQRGFVAQIGQQLLDPETSPFELLDGQRKAFAECLAVISGSFHRSTKKAPPKRVVIVNGPPGSGKSVIAARLWASLVTDTKLPEGDVVLATTSTSQNRNWAYLMEEAGRDRGARGVVRKATGFTPISTQELGRLRRRRSATWLGEASKWRDNLKSLRALVDFRDGAGDNANLVSIVDEAHALINPEHTAGRGQFGFVVSLGPQAYHVIRTSMLTVFLLDPRQGFRSRENTTLHDIREWSRELGAGAPIEISLEGMQFRCAGSTEYVRWVESLLEGASAAQNATLGRSWYHRMPSKAPAVAKSKRRGGNARSMEFQVFDNPDDWEEALRSRVKQGHSARLLSTYSRPWKTAKATSPHDLAASEMDFHERYVRGGRASHWSRIWNHVPHEDYSWFVSGRPGSRIAEDQLSEVGCPYVVRGFDFDYVGLLWLDDLAWRANRWRVDPVKVHETGFSALTRAAQRAARRGDGGKEISELLDRVGQAYRILLTRAIKGVYAWVPDRETREHLAASVGTAKGANANSAPWSSEE